MSNNIKTHKAMSRIILHIDMDAFFTSVEQRDNPIYKGKPVVVGALPGNRGVVSAASYEARKFGIHSAMPISEAFKRCPSAVYLTPRMDAYSEESGLIMNILSSFSPMIEQVSVDEAFIDITGSEKLFGTPQDVATKISRAIKTQRNLTASIGIAPNKFLAKIASDLNKPDGISPVPFEPERIIEWLAPMKVGKIWGVGKKTEEVLRRLNIGTIGDLQKLSKDFLSDFFGTYGGALYEFARGIDSRSVENRESAKSISRETTFGTDTRDRVLLKKSLLVLSQDVARQARKAQLSGKTIILIYRGTDFAKHSRRTTLFEGTSSANALYAVVSKKLEELPFDMDFRLIGVGLAGFQETIQMDLFAATKPSSAWENSEKAIDKLADRFGSGIIVRGSEL